MQIVSVSKSRRKRRRAATDDVEVVFVERLPSPELLEISRVELPLDDSVIITAVSETDVCTPSKKVSCKFFFEKINRFCFTII